MPIALTADVHLKPTYHEAPERYDALVDILDQLQDQGITELILAGDTYDKDVTDPSLLDELLKQYPAIQVYMIPGNHDPNLRPEAFTADNLTLVTEPTWQQLGEPPTPFLLIPYQGVQSMGAALAEVDQDQTFPADGAPWYLVGHGDHLTGSKPPNPYEPGIYMPLTGHDLGQYQPSAALLGHIHVRNSAQQVHYPGSPCGLDITETGRRYFTLLYPESNTLAAQPINTSVIYLNEHLVMLPLPDEATYLRQQLRQLKAQWDFPETEHQRAVVRLRLSGYSQDRRQLPPIIHEELPAVQWEEGSPDIARVQTLADPLKVELVQQMQEKLDREQETLGQLEVPRNQVLEKALTYILNP
jgi:DNA repair exonuclease SbcCD nuclease subunit